MTDHPTTLSLTNDDRLALRRFISEHRQGTGEELSLEEAALMILRDGMVRLRLMEVDPEGEE